MLRKSLLLFVLVLGMFLIADAVQAEPAIIKDILVETVDSSVKLSITSNQTVQIETFQNDDSPANYIVLDFLGTVYTNIPPVIEVASGPVEKVSLVRGEEKKIQMLGEDYYSLDFLAINLNTTADYHVNQTKSVIDLSIGAKIGSVQSSSYGSSYSRGDAVELSPPIVVAKEQDKSRDQDGYVPERKSTFSYGKQGEEVKKEEKKKTKKKRRGLFGLFSGRKKKTSDKVETPEAPKEYVEKRAKPQYTKPRTRKQDLLIDRIVTDTIQEKEYTVARIDDLTMELRKMQEELSLSKGEKSQIEDKINAILAKLDELKDALDEEISRRRSLGEKVEELEAKREEYVKAKRAYEDIEQKYGHVSVKVDGLNAEVTSLRSRLESMQLEKKNLEQEVNLMSDQYSKAKAGYSSAIQQKDSLTFKIDKLTRELDSLRLSIDKMVQEQAIVETELRELDTATRYSDEELRRLKQRLIEKNSSVLELTRRHNQLKAELETSVSEKFKVEYSYRNAKTEFERIKREIENFLNN